MNNGVIESFNKFAEQYADITFLNILQYELNRFISLIPREGKVLDLGCGGGRDVQYFADFKLEAVGIDASIKLIDEAKKRVNGNFEVMDMRNLTFKDEEFNGVWAQDAISYVTKEDVINVLKHISRILKKEGVFFISVRKGSDEILILHEKLGKNEVMVGFYEINELEALLREAGFEIMNTYIQDGNDFTWINIFAKKI
ncbi:class I SAM-dependent methyltransferase [Candidatus Woesearchaeota archaeon]|nr:class I SAM-dependent methyltransferase [Candidatus Woesearchaeota archaeon]